MAILYNNIGKHLLSAASLCFNSWLISEAFTSLYLFPR